MDKKIPAGLTGKCEGKICIDNVIGYNSIYINIYFSSTEKYIFMRIKIYPH